MASPIAKEPKTDEAIVKADVAMAEAREERPTAASTAEFTMDESEEERPLEAAEQEWL